MSDDRGTNATAELTPRRQTLARHLDFLTPGNSSASSTSRNWLAQLHERSTEVHGRLLPTTTIVTQIVTHPNVGRAGRSASIPGL
jgi:hypothetical protein